MVYQVFPLRSIPVHSFPCVPHFNFPRQIGVDRILVVLLDDLVDRSQLFTVGNLQQLIEIIEGLVVFVGTDHSVKHAAIGGSDRSNLVGDMRGGFLFRTNRSGGRVGLASPHGMTNLLQAC